MERILRIKSYIIATLACAIFLIIAAVSVSIAQWISSPAVTKAETSAKVGLFYVSATDGQTVRSVSGACNAENSYTYRNYVCVFRATENIDYTYINFEIEPKDGTGDVDVTAFSVTRAQADKSGMPIGESTAMEVFNAPTRLSDFSADNFISAPYVKLQFEPNEGQYFALDITITTSGDAEFLFTATAADNDLHEWRVPDEYFLGYDMWKMNATSKMTGTATANGTTTDENGIVRDILDADFQIKVALKADTVIKMIRSDGDTGANIAVYFRPKHDSASLISDCAEVMPAGEVKINKSGLFIIRYYGKAEYFMTHANGSVEYKIEKIEVTLVREITETLTETDEAGSYIVGIFTDNKTVKEFALRDDYEYIEGFKEYDWSQCADVRKGDRFRVVTIDADGNRTETQQAEISVTSRGEKKMLFDEYENKAYGDDGVYRFIVNPNGIAPTGMTIGYRRIISGLTTNSAPAPSDALATEDAAVMGYQFETGALKPVPDSAGRYYADIPYNEVLAGKTSNLGVRITGGVAGDIVSVTVHGTGANSYNINKYTGAFDGFAGGYSYEITASEVPQATDGTLTSADCVNWTGTVSQGRTGEGVPFALENGGYVILDANGGKISDLSRDDTSENRPYVAEVKKTEFGSRRFVVYINGNAKALKNDDEIPRVTKINHIPYAFSTVNSVKALGTYFIGAGADAINIAFLSQDVGSEIIDGDVWQDGYSEGYFAVGQFSRWKVYDEYRLSRGADSAVNWAFEHDKVITSADVQENPDITTADKYKIVFVKNKNGKVSFTWYGKTASGDFSSALSADNITADDTVLPFDAKAVWGAEVTPAAGECYAVGSFSDWKIYDYFKMSSRGVFEITDFHIQSGDSYKVVYDTIYRGLTRGEGDDGNLTATSSSVCFDVYKMFADNKSTWHDLDAEYFAPLSDDVVRVTLFTAKTDVKIWIWHIVDDDKNINYTPEGWEYRPSMTKAGSLNVWYFDIVKRANFPSVSAMLFTYSGGQTGDRLVSVDWGGYVSFNL